MPRSPRALVRWPVVSEVLMRSPVEARCEGVAADMTFLLATTPGSGQVRSGVYRDQANDVIVHDVGKEQQKEDEANLNETFFDRHAQIATHQAFNAEQQNLPAIKNRKRQKVEDAEVHADKGHQQDDLRWATANRFAGNLRDANNALQLLDARASAEKFADHAHRLCEKITGFSESVLGGFTKRGALINDVVLIDNTNLPGVFRAVAQSLLRSHAERKNLALSRNL